MTKQKAPKNMSEVAPEPSAPRRGSGSGQGRGRDKRRPDLDTLYSVNRDGSRNMLHPADVSGRWQVRKNLIYASLVAVYLALPWIQVNGQPAVHFDLPGRTAHLFGASFTNQDFYLVFFLLLSLFFS